jgi:hypothetical protein
LAAISRLILFDLAALACLVDAGKEGKGSRLSLAAF